MCSEVIALFATLAQAQKYCISTEALEVVESVVESVVEQIVEGAGTKPPAIAPDRET
jgi:hypothetical protein